jgi:hypothetical protein
MSSLHKGIIMQTLLSTIEEFIAGRSDLTNNIMDLLIEEECTAMQLTPADKELLSNHAEECRDLVNRNEAQDLRIAIVQIALER